MVKACSVIAVLSLFGYSAEQKRRSPQRVLTATTMFQIFSYSLWTQKNRGLGTFWLVRWKLGLLAAYQRGQRLNVDFILSPGTTKGFKIGRRQSPNGKSNILLRRKESDKTRMRVPLGTQTNLDYWVGSECRVFGISRTFAHSPHVILTHLAPINSFRLYVFQFRNFSLRINKIAEDDQLTHQASKYDGSLSYPVEFWLIN